MPNSENRSRRGSKNSSSSLLNRQFGLRPCSYLKILGALVPSLPKGTLKRKERSDSIRSIGFAEDHRFNITWLR
jgi:hypothetical protein